MDESIADYFDRLDKMYEECEKKMETLLINLMELQKGEEDGKKRYSE